MAANRIDLIFEFEPIVKVSCKAVDCKNNLIKTPLGLAACNLKNISLGKTGLCENFEHRDKDKNG